MGQYSPSHKVRNAQFPSVVSSGGRQNTLGLSPRELEKMLDRFDAMMKDNTHPNRVFTRWRYRLDHVRLQIIHPGGSVAEMPVVCRNLSCGGVGILHSKYLHPGSGVRIVLPHPSQGDVTVPGTVRRCQHREGVVHDIGIEFNQPLTVREYLGLDLLSDAFSHELVDATSLRGSVLHIEPNLVDRKIVQHFVRDTRINLRQAQTSTEGLQMLDEPADVILLSDRVSGPSPAEFTEVLRNRGVQSPVIILTEESCADVITASIAMQIDAVLTKPLRQSLLQRALAEFLLHKQRGDGANSPSGSWAGPSPKQEMRLLAADLSNAIGSNDTPSCRALVQQIRSLAQRIGMDDLVSVAEGTMQHLSATGSIEESIRQLLDLTTACEGPDQIRAA